MALFNRYMAVDWSAANSPKRGKDSIWISGCSNKYNIPPRNISTRAETLGVIKDHILATLKSDEKLLIGFDFAFGYPHGTAKALGGQDWQFIWGVIHDITQDTPKNKSNRFEVASRLNKIIGAQEGPFWGHPHHHQYDGLKPKKPPVLHPDIEEFRCVESHARSAKSVWQLAYNGAVGSQTLLGIAALEKLRRDSDIGHHIAIWPFETRFAENLAKPIVFAEIYPSSHMGWREMPYDITDAQQVAKVCADLKQWDEQGLLGSKLTADVSDALRKSVLGEEGWIVGQ